MGTVCVGSEFSAGNRVVVEGRTNQVAGKGWRYKVFNQIYKAVK